MSEMVERVAQAIAKATNETWAGFSESHKNMHRIRARAAIEAMREPTAEMIEEGRVGALEISTNAVVTTWRGMVDRALR